jgi:hypothetical protein
MMRRGASSWVLALLVGAPGAAAVAAPDAEPEPEPRWALRAQGQLPVIAADHAVGGFGLALAAERGLWAIAAEAQFLPIVVCDDTCGSAYAGAVGIALQPELGRGVSAHLELLARYYAHPSLHQYFPAYGPRIGVRWPGQGSAISLDVGVSFAARRNFDDGAFAQNKVIGWGMPEAVLGLWF